MIEQVQGFDPAGVAARDLSECLPHSIAPQRQAATRLESRIVQHHLEELSRRKLPEIARQFHVSLPDVQEAAEAIARLEPRPGRPFSTEDEQAILPDVLVERDGDSYTVSLNDDEIPSLRIGDRYKDMLSQSASDREVRDYLREKIRGGRFFIRCVQQRQHTLLNIAREIVERQRDFFDLGPAHLRPMTMSKVAQAVGVHETTVSRAVLGKVYGHAAGLFELKYFFTSGYTTNDGESVSNESVRRAIAEIVRGEDSRHPLSDQGVVEMLAERGLPIARRTVAKLTGATRNIAQPFPQGLLGRSSSESARLSLRIAGNDIDVTMLPLDEQTLRNALRAVKYPGFSRRHCLVWPGQGNPRPG